MSMSEKEQIELFTAWWKDNGASLLMAVAVFIAVYGGWTGWRAHQQGQADQASALFQHILDVRNGKTTDSATGEKLPALADLAKQLETGYASTYYGQAVHLLLADEAVKKNDLATAEQELTALVDAKPNEALAVTARLRLARVLFAEGKYPEALARLDGSVPEAYKSFFAELRGDVHAAAGNPDKAELAYNEALTSLQKDNEALRGNIEMKLAHVQGAAAAAPAPAAH